MKNLNKVIIYVMLIFISSYSFASMNNNYEELVNKMAQNKNVKIFIEHSIKSLALNYKSQMIKDSKISGIFDEYKNDYLTELNVAIEYKKTIEFDFPEYALLSVEDKVVVFKSILNTPSIYFSVATIAKCWGKGIAGYIICAVGTISAVVGTYFGACAAACILVDITGAVVAVAAAGPAGVGAVIAAAEPTLLLQATSCYNWATTATAGTGLVVVQGCALAANAYWLICSNIQ